MAEVTAGDKQEEVVALEVVAVDIAVVGACRPSGKGYMMLEEAGPGKRVVMVLYFAL